MSDLDFRQRRIARALLFAALISPLLGPFAAVVMPVLSVVALIRAKRWRPLLLFGAVVCGGALLGMLGSFGSETLPRLLDGAAWLGMSAFAAACLSCPTWLALALWGEDRPQWHSIAYGLGLLLVGFGVPLLALTLLGLQLALLAGLASTAALAWAAWPLFRMLPPVPELLPLVQALGLKATRGGWEGDGIFLGRRGQLTLNLPFPTPIPGLFAAKRGPDATRPLLGDAVLDHTLELSLPAHLQHLAEQPALLLAAVHGAQATLSPGQLSLDRRLDTAAFNADPRGSRDQALRELEAVRALHAALSQPV